MSQPDPQTATDHPRWTGASIALFVGGLEMLALGLLAHMWMGRSNIMPSDILELPIQAISAIGAGWVMAAGVALAIAGFMLARRKRAASQEEEAPPRWNIVSAALFVIGLLVIVPSGLCSGVLLVSSGGGLFIFALIYGGVPIAIGATLVAIGLTTRRSD
jgi:hypothetical protein